MRPEEIKVLPGRSRNSVCPGFRLTACDGPTGCPELFTNPSCASTGVPGPTGTGPFTTVSLNVCVGLTPMPAKWMGGGATRIEPAPPMVMNPGWLIDASPVDPNVDSTAPLEPL